MKIVDYQYLIIINQILDYLALCSVVGHCQLLIKGSTISFIDAYSHISYTKINSKLRLPCFSSSILPAGCHYNSV